MRDNETRWPAPQAEADGLIEGRNAVIEPCGPERPLTRSICQGRDGQDPGPYRLPGPGGRCGGGGGGPAEAGRHEPHPRPSGVIALAAVREYVSVDDILADAAAKNESPLIVVCDEISDPHNLGAIIRTAYCAGAHGVVIPKRRSAGLTSVVAKTSAGGGVPPAGGPGGQPALPAQAAEEGGPLDLRRRRRRPRLPV